MIIESLGYSTEMCTHTYLSKNDLLSKVTICMYVVYIRYETIRVITKNPYLH